LLNNVDRPAASSVILLATALAVGCAGNPTSPPEQSTKYFGKSIFRGWNQSKPNHPVNAGYSAYMFGATGALMAEISGTPGHYVYKLQSNSAETYHIATTEEHPIGTCFEFWAKKDFPDQTSWAFGQAYVIQKPCP